MSDKTESSKMTFVEWVMKGCPCDGSAELSPQWMWDEDTDMEWRRFLAESGEARRNEDENCRSAR